MYTTRALLLHDRLRSLKTIRDFLVLGTVERLGVGLPGRTRHQSTGSATAEYSVDTVVIGGGCVGLAIARQLSMTSSGGDGVLLVEKNETFGQETSSRNSEVVHAGIYYPPGSLKARLCVQGKHALYKYCQENNVMYSTCGKLLVASTAREVSVLHEIHDVALRNGVDDVRKVTREEVRSVFGEPGIICLEGLFSPSSGIVNSHGFMASLERDIVSNGGMISYNTRVVGGVLNKGTREDEKDKRHTLYMEDEVTGTVTPISCKAIVNSAGLWARKVSLALLGDSYSDTIPHVSFVKGNYFVPKRREYFGEISRKHLIYPVPSDDGGLGVHATIDVQNHDLRFGPDVEWLDGHDDPDTIDYGVNPERADLFRNAIGTYYRLQGDECLEAAYSGVRPKATTLKNNVTNHDFVIETHDVPGFVGLYGIESPGLTSCLALAEYTAEKLIQ